MLEATEIFTKLDSRRFADFAERNAALRRNEYNFKMADFTRKTKWLQNFEDAKVEYTTRYNATWQAKYESCLQALIRLRFIASKLDYIIEIPHRLLNLLEGNNLAECWNKGGG